MFSCEFCKKFQEYLFHCGRLLLRANQWGLDQCAQVYCFLYCFVHLFLHSFLFIRISEFDLRLNFSYFHDWNSHKNMCKLHILRGCFLPCSNLTNLQILRFRSSCLEVLCKKGVLKHFPNSQRNGGLEACNFIKKRLQHRWFPVNFAKILRASILQNFCEWLLLEIDKATSEASCS